MKKKRKSEPIPRPSRSPFHPFMLDLSGVSKREADQIEQAIAEAFRKKGLIP